MSEDVEAMLVRLVELCSESHEARRMVAGHFFERQTDLPPNSDEHECVAEVRKSIEKLGE